jgi:glycosyltransferase involved in cell wall biosynthesis
MSAATIRSVATTISVVLPTYNGADHIAAAVRSLRAQTVPPWEVVISDSGSTDGTLDIVRAELAGAPFPVRILPRRTAGMVKNWNAAISAARGEFVKFLFQDDVLEPRCLEFFGAAAGAEHRLGMAWCSRRLILEGDPDTHPAAKWLVENPTLDRYMLEIDNRPHPGWRVLGARRLMEGSPNKIGEPTAVMIRTDLLCRIGGFSERLAQLVDVELYYRVMARSWVQFIDEPLAAFRVHGKQMTVKNSEIDAAAADQLELMRVLGQPEIYRYLHPRARRLLREGCEKAGLHGAATYPLYDRCYESARWVKRTGENWLNSGGATPRV